MAKNVKKAKPTASKPASKAAPKPAKKQAKVAAKPAKKPAPAAKAKPAAAPKKAEAPAAKAGKAPKKVAAVIPADAGTQAKAAKPAKAPKVSKGKKGKSDELEDDDLMVSDEDIGAEEIPDLAEFDEEEEEEEVVAESDSDTDDSEDAVVAVAAPSGDEEAVLTDAEGRPYCKVKDCDQIAAVDAYCRYHYLLLWKKIQVRRKILIDGKLERYVEELTSRYPDKFLEMIRRDLRTEKDFQAAIAELEIDESGIDNEFEDEAQVLDEVRGFGSESSISDEEEF